MLPGLFKWLGEDFDRSHLGSLQRLIIEAFNIYNQYYQTRLSKPYIRQVRNIWFSLIQIVRQDPIYYAFYMLYRLDYLQKLVSFLYYTKRIYPRECTFFYYIDINLIDLIYSRRGANALQGSLALSNKDSSNYTKLLIRIYRDIAIWYKRLVDRGYAKDGYIQRINAEYR